MPVRIILLGPPGAGKGTQAALLAQHFEVPAISTSAMLREAVAAKTTLGLIAEQIMERGQLVADEVILGLVKERLKQSDCDHGFLFDGFPRTLAQAEGLRAAGVTIDAVIHISLADDAIVDRISGRLVHAASGRSYHTRFAPPKVAGKDDETGEPLIVRRDDQEATVRRRLQIYHQQTHPLVNYYKSLASAEKNAAPRYCSVDGAAGVEQVREEIIKHMEGL